MENRDVITLKSSLCELKLKLLNITLSLEDDGRYSKSNAVDELLKVVKELEVIEEII